jgi:hypothetical protein
VSRRLGERVDVVRRDSAPEQFLWRGRLYVVRAVLAEWVEAGQWWEPRRASEGAAAAARVGADESPVATRSLDHRPKWGESAWGEPAPEIGVAIGPLGLDDRERSYWRVEAAAGRGAPIGVFDLCFDWSRSDWFLSRVAD